MKKIVTLFLLFCLMPALCFAKNEREYLEQKSRHFIVKYHQTIPADFIEKIIDYGERYYDKITDRLGFKRFDYWTWSDRATIYIYPDQETYQKETNQPEWSAGCASYDKKTIWSYPHDAGFFDTLLPHELGHIIFRDVIGHRSVPLWLEEGVACHSETARRLGADKTVLKAMESKTFMSLDQLSSLKVHGIEDRELVDLFYAESVSIVNFMINQYKIRSFNLFCERIRKGKNMDQAIKDAFYKIHNQEELNEAWVKSLKKKK